MTLPCLPDYPRCLHALTLSGVPDPLDDWGVGLLSRAQGWGCCSEALTICLCSAWPSRIQPPPPGAVKDYDAEAMPSCLHEAELVDKATLHGTAALSSLHGVVRGRHQCTLPWVLGQTQTVRAMVQVDCSTMKCLLCVPCAQGRGSWTMMWHPWC